MIDTLADLSGSQEKSTASASLSSGQALIASAAPAVVTAPGPAPPAAHAGAQAQEPSRTHGGEGEISMNAAQTENVLLASGEFCCWVSMCPSNAV